MTCSTLGNLRTLKPNRFKNQSSDTLNLLDQNCNHQQGLFQQKTVALHHRVLSSNFLNTVIVIAIIDETVVTGD